LFLKIISAYKGEKNMFNHMKVRTRIIVGFVTILVMMLVTMGVTFYNVEQMQHSTDYIVQDAIPLARITDRIMLSMVNEETGVRGFIASNGDENMLGAYNNARKELAAAVKELEPLLADHPTMARIVKEESAPAIEAINTYFESQIILVRSGNLEEARKRLGDGKALFAKYREAHAKMQADVEVVTKRDRDAANSAATTTKWASIVVFVISLIAGLTMAIRLSGEIAKRLNIDVMALKEVANGNLAIEELRVKSEDEIGEIGHSINATVKNLKELIGVVAQVTHQVAALSEELTANAEQSAQAAEQVATSITTVANGSERQNGVVNDVSSIVEQMAASSQEIAANTITVAHSSEKAAASAKEGGKTIREAVAQMISIEKTVNGSAQVVTHLGERSKEIGQIVETISGIAGQTNLLALNAAIEAARAGEQGRGFAVVAEEVRKLAEQSQDAAKKIATLIGEIQAETAKAVEAMHEGTKEVKIGGESVASAGQAFTQIVALVEEVNGQIRQISKATQQMADGSQKVVNAMSEIAISSKGNAAEAQTVSAAAEEQSASMEEIASSSETLAKLAEDLQLSVAKFRL
jgi:methyl-accepting chemotaxis protein